MDLDPMDADLSNCGEVLAVTTGFSSAGFFSRWFAAHPCQARPAETCETGSCMSCMVISWET